MPSADGRELCGYSEHRDHELRRALPKTTLEQYKKLANDLVEAYGSGESGALRRLAEHFQFKRALTWDQLPGTLGSS